MKQALFVVLSPFDNKQFQCVTKCIKFTLLLSNTFAKVIANVFQANNTV